MTKAPFSKNPISKRVYNWEKRLEEESKEDSHYHVTMVAPNITIVPKIVSNESLAMSEWTKMINMIYDLSGVKVKIWGEKMATFENGAHVRWFQCSHDCLETPGVKLLRE